MIAPWWLSDGLAAFMVLIAAYCAIRPAAARRWRRSTERDVDLAHVLMGAAMAATLAPRLNPVRDDIWAVALAALTAWFAVRAAQDRRQRLAGHADSPRAAFFRRASSSARQAHGTGTGPGWAPSSARQARSPSPGWAPSSARQARSPGPGHHLVHLLSCASMLYMLLAASSAGLAAAAVGTGPAGLTGPAMAAESATGASGISPVIALVLAVAMAGSVVLATDRLATLAPARVGASAAGEAASSAAWTGQSPAAGVAPSSRRAILCPRLAAFCQIAMGITMVYMLVQLL
jgi:hypothetical protein